SPPWNDVCDGPTVIPLGPLDAKMRIFLFGSQLFQSQLLPLRPAHSFSLLTEMSPLANRTAWQSPTLVQLPPLPVPVYVIGKLPGVVAVTLPSMYTVALIVSTRFVASYDSWPCGVTHE